LTLLRKWNRNFPGGREILRGGKKRKKKKGNYLERPHVRAHSEERGENSVDSAGRGKGD